ncbi:hypothetical protein JOM56_005461 [Amanita muscaria]
MLTNVQRDLVVGISQALFYGIYIATIIQCFRWLIFTDEGWKPRGKANSLSVQAFATIFVFLTSTTNLIASQQYMLQDPGRYGRNMRGSALAMDISGGLGTVSVDSALVSACPVVS